MSRLKVGIIGLGVGERHIAGYREHPDCEVVALCDFDEGKRREVAARHPGIAMKASADEVLDDPAIDVVSIATYDNWHFEQAARAIRNGKHVFVEKPVCLHEEEARQLRELLNQHPEVVLSSNLVLRMSPRFASLKAMIEAGELGDLYYAEADYNYGRLHKLTDGWRGKLDYYSVVHGGAVHMVDLLLWLTGDRIVEVQAYGNRICSRDSAFRFDDMVVACVRFERGMIGKGARNKEARDAMVKYGAVYFAAVGGAGALIARSIKKARVVAYEDLGAEAIYEFTVEDFPAIVVNDVYGNDLYEEGVRQYQRA